MCEKDIRGEYDRLKDKECRLKVVQYREGRSLDANAYFHVLVGKIAEVTDNSKVYIKNKLIAEYGQHEIINSSLVSLPLDNDIEVTVAEAKELGIETATPQEIKEMEERWRVKLEKAN